MSTEASPDGNSTNKGLLTILFASYLLVLIVFCVWEHRIMFAWPAGLVVGNLLASAIWAPLAVIHLDRLARKHHREHMALLRRHHAELKTVICAPPGATPAVTVAHETDVTSAEGR